MFPSVEYAIVADRYVPHTDYADFVGFDFTGAYTLMQVRDHPNGGAVRAGVTPSISVTTTDGVPTTRVTWLIGESDMEAMPFAADPDKDNVIYYDILIDPTDDYKFVALRGTFTVRAGVSQ